MNKYMLKMNTITTAGSAYLTRGCILVLSTSVDGQEMVKVTKMHSPYLLEIRHATWLDLRWNDVRSWLGNVWRNIKYTWWDILAHFTGEDSD